MRPLIWILAVVCCASVSRFAAADTVSLTELAKSGRLLMLRHAHAPGTGDPAAFRLDECSTQRNLDDAGRRQAAALGRKIAEAGVRQAKIYSSQWCRCLDTARLLDLGPVEPLSALNSFFARADQREPTLVRLRAFLAGLPRDGAPVVLVTHQVTVSAFSGSGVASGSGSLFELNGTGAPRLLGDITAD